jgi:probable O-glycosylation ligase (exosortase A-associated)
MHDAALLLTVLIGMLFSIAYPFAGLLLWLWYAIMFPQDGAYGLTRTLPLNFLIAGVAAFSWLASRRERKLPAFSATFALVVIFLCWMTFNSFFATIPSWSWPYWDRVWKIYASGILAMILVTNAVRFQALMWIVVVSLSYWGVRGGIFTILGGGQFRVFGPDSSEIADNNNFALVIVSMLPLLYYLRQHSGSTIVRMVLLAGLGLDLLTVLGSYSRGAVVSLAVLAIAAWLRTRTKLIYPVAAAIVLIPAVYFMPPSFFERMNTISSYQEDGSFEGRVSAWHVAIDVAVQDFPFGAGFYAPQLPQIFHRFMPDVEPHAAHSIYFQVLGEHGFIGLGIYLLMIASAFLNLRSVIRKTTKLPELAWANDLARMMQLSMLAFCVGGALLSVAYYDLFTLNICLSAALQEYVRKALARTPGKAADARSAAVRRPLVPAMQLGAGGGGAPSAPPSSEAAI